MNPEQRRKRLRLLIKKLNKERKKQAQKIDILCNNLIAAQREFIKRLNAVLFTANFYESILGTTDLSTLLSTASRLIKEKIANANVVFFLRKANSYELYMFDGEKPDIAPMYLLENCFSGELIDNICKSSKQCTLDDMFAMGLQGNLKALNKLSAITIPLGQFGASRGFILIYRRSQNRLTAGEIDNISNVVCGLYRAIQSCQVLLPSGD